MATVEGKSKENLVYVDESGIDKYIYNPYGWSRSVKKIDGEISGKRYSRESFIAGKMGSRIIAPFCFRGICNTDLFNVWVEKILVPEILPGQTIIMDNATFHKSSRTRELIERAGCELLFLPPYSPDLNPIKKFWAILKTKIRNIIEDFSSLNQSIDFAFNSFLS